MKYALLSLLIAMPGFAKDMDWVEYKGVKYIEFQHKYYNCGECEEYLRVMRSWQENTRQVIAQCLKDSGCEGKTAAQLGITSAVVIVPPVTADVFQRACDELGKVKSVVVDGVACQIPLNEQYRKDYSELGMFGKGNLPSPEKRSALPWTQDPLNGLQSRSNWCALAYKWFFATPLDKRPEFAKKTTCQGWLSEQYKSYMRSRGSGFIPAEDGASAPE